MKMRKIYNKLFLKKFMEDDSKLREQLVNLFEKREAHAMLSDAVADFPEDKYNAKVEGVEYSFWQLLEHIRISQKDILEFMTNPEYEEMEWPKDYWPNTEEKATKEDWQKTISKIKEDQDKIVKIIKDPKTDIYKKIPWGKGQINLREILIVARHTSYHISSFILMRKVLGIWK